MREREPYPSDLSDKEWAVIRQLLPEKGRLGRPPKHSQRRVVEAIFYVARGGIAWRMLPNDFPHWRLVYYYFAKWQKLGVWEQLNGKLRDRVRAKSGKKKAPSAAILDSASVRMAGQRGDRGFDAGKKVDGRKRHLLVDTLGLILSVVVHSASIQDRDGAKLVLEKARWFGWLSKIWADGGYAGALVQWVRKARLGRGARLEIVSKAPGAFQVLPKRWIVERTHAWLSRYRRLARDYEEFTTHSEAFTYVAASAMMTRRLAKIGKR